MMDREILFRAKHKEYDEWVEGDLLHEACGFRIKFSKNGCKSEIRVDPETVCQYTGIEDKNGRKIFEGDIAKQFADCNGSGENLYFFYKIRWNEEYCAFEGYEIYTKETFFFPDLEDIEVVGNIFDNSEFLKGEKEEWKD